MKVKLNSGVEYWVSWYHYTQHNENPYVPFPFYGTKCIIENKTETNHLSQGIAKLAQGDRFCKDRGRKIALKRALNAMGLDKPTRTLFWNSYFKMTNK